jgi:hypothetical protein
VARPLLFGLIALLAGCGDLPRPFAGHPGATAIRLSQPPPARLAVPVPTDALLTDAASSTYAAAVAAALQDQEVPAVEGVAHKGDWRLRVTAELRGNKVVPQFTVENPDGKPQGSTEGAPVDAGQWADAVKPVLDGSASTAGPAVAALLTRIEAQRQQNDPNSLLNRPARIAVLDVTGAPGDGNTSLTRQMKLHLPRIGEVLAQTRTDADFTVRAEVKLAVAEKGQQRIEIQWIVANARGDELGRVVQLNDIAAGSLDGLWGDVAAVVAQEAAGGVRDVVLNQTGKRATAPASAAVIPPSK